MPSSRVVMCARFHLPLHIHLFLGIPSLITSPSSHCRHYIAGIIPLPSNRSQHIAVITSQSSHRSQHIAVITPLSPHRCHHIAVFTPLSLHCCHHIAIITLQPSHRCHPIHTRHIAVSLSLHVTVTLQYVYQSSPSKNHHILTLGLST